MKATIQWLVETIVRFTSKTPKYLVVLQVLLLLMIAANAVITHMVSAGTFTNPAPWVQTLFVGTDAIVPYIISILTAQLAVKDDVKKDVKVAQITGKK